MALPSSIFLVKPFILFLLSLSSVLADFSIVDLDFNGQDYSPPSQPPNPPSPPHPPSLSCEDDLKGIGSLNESCLINTSLDFDADVYIAGAGRIDVLPGVFLRCAVAGCSITVNISGDFTLGENSSVVAGTFTVSAGDIALLENSLINTTALAGPPPVESSGTPLGIGGGGAGHGGRGACCSTDKRKLPEDVWGGDTYAWSSLSVPVSYGSKGGTTSGEEDRGGRGGGQVWMKAENAIEVNGTVVVDGGDGGLQGGGGSGGSIYIKAQKM